MHYTDKEKEEDDDDDEEEETTVEFLLIKWAIWSSGTLVYWMLIWIF